MSQGKMAGGAPGGALGARRAVNEAVVRRYCDAWSRGDLPAIVDCYHEELVLHYFGRSPLAGEHRGYF